MSKNLFHSLPFRWKFVSALSLVHFKKLRLGSSKNPRQHTLEPQWLSVQRITIYQLSVKLEPHESRGMQNKAIIEASQRFSPSLRKKKAFFSTSVPPLFRFYSCHSPLIENLRILNQCEIRYHSDLEQ